MKTIFVFVMLFVSLCRADDLYKKDGFVIFNVIVSDTVAVDTSTYVNIIYNDNKSLVVVDTILSGGEKQRINSFSRKLLKISIHNIAKIIKSPFIPTLESRFESIDANIARALGFGLPSLKEHNNISAVGALIVKKEFPNRVFNWIALTNAIIATEYFLSASSASNQKKYWETADRSNPSDFYKENIDFYGKTATRQTIIGGLFTLASVYFVVYANTAVDIVVNPKSISLALNF